MRSLFSHVMTPVVLAMAISGCASGGPFHLFARNSHPARIPPIRMRVEGAVATRAHSVTQDGRDQLAAGLTGKAIESFQRALSAGEPVAPALNGLGVAFARLDRPDLARRYFEEAMAQDPANVNYRANLSLVEHPSVDGMPQHASDADRPVAAGDLRADTGQDQPIHKALPIAPGRLQRISRGEVYIATLPVQLAPRFAARPNPRANSARMGDGAVRGQAALEDGAIVRFRLPDPKPMVDAIPGMQSLTHHAQAGNSDHSRSGLNRRLADADQSNRGFVPLVRIVLPQVEEHAVAKTRP